MTLKNQSAISIISDQHSHGTVSPKINDFNFDLQLFKWGYQPGWISALINPSIIAFATHIILMSNGWNQDENIPRAYHIMFPHQTSIQMLLISFIFE